MGRWKANNDGSPYYDAQDTGPDQVSGMGAPPAPPANTDQPGPTPNVWSGAGGNAGEGAGGMTGQAQMPGWGPVKVSTSFNPDPNDPSTHPMTPGSGWGDIVKQAQGAAQGGQTGAPPTPVGGGMSGFIRQFLARQGGQGMGAAQAAGGGMMHEQVMPQLPGQGSGIPLPNQPPDMPGQGGQMFPPSSQGDFIPTAKRPPFQGDPGMQMSPEGKSLMEMLLQRKMQGR